MTNKKCVLPEGSERKVHKGYEEVLVPRTKQKPMGPNEKLVPRSAIPAWAAEAFPDYVKSLNRMQSRLYPCAFESDENLLLCAPTGAGKTNVALLTVLHEIGKHRKEDGSFDLESFKVGWWSYEHELQLLTDGGVWLLDYLHCPYEVAGCRDDG
jgi:pre-mRNA-splicing helicase BRR2